MLSNRPELSAPAVDRAASSELGTRAGTSTRLKLFGACVLALVLCFIRPLYDLVRFALHSELYSYVLLVPFISAYLIRLNSKRRAHETNCRRRGHETLTSICLFLLGIALLFIYFWTRRSGHALPEQDYLAFTIAAFLSFGAPICLALFSRHSLRPLAFPLIFLLFLIPFPLAMESWIKGFFQHASAHAAYALFSLSGMPVLRDGTSFQLPGFSLQIAPECSGIHSSLVLFIVSILAGYELLTLVWSRAFFALAVIPLGILRNGFRVFVLGQLCVKVSPDWINSRLHHEGGPIFFALSLLPFCLLLIFLRKFEAKARKSRFLQ